MPDDPSNMQMYDKNRLTASLVYHEGYRRYAYADSRGNLSIGIGRNLEAKGVTYPEAFMMMQDDVTEAIIALNANIPWWSTLPDMQQRALIELCFNMGWGDGQHGLSSFTTFLGLMRQGTFMSAAHDLVGTAWARQVQPTRVNDIANLVIGKEPVIPSVQREVTG